MDKNICQTYSTFNPIIKNTKIIPNIDRVRLFNNLINDMKIGIFIEPPKISLII